MSDLDFSFTPNHRARICVKRLLRADEIATVLRDVLAVMNGERDPVVVADWGDMFVESSQQLDGYIDVLPLGQMAYRMLTGNEATGSVSYVPGAPPLLARLIQRMVSTDPLARPNILEVKAVIATMLGGPREDSVVLELPTAPAVGTLVPGAPEEVLELAVGSGTTAKDEFDEPLNLEEADVPAEMLDLGEDPIPLPPPKPIAKPMPRIEPPASARRALDAHRAATMPIPVQVVAPADEVLDLGEAFPDESTDETLTLD